MAEQFRNEIDIELKGPRTMRPSFQEIREIERQLGKSITRIINDVVGQGDLSITDAAVIVHQGLKGFGDTSLTFAQVGQALVEEGFAERAPAVVQFLTLALKGPLMGKPLPETGD